MKFIVGGLTNSCFHVEDGDLPSVSYLQYAAGESDIPGPHEVE